MGTPIPPGRSARTGTVHSEKRLLTREVEWRSGKLLPAGMGYVIAGAGTCPEAGDVELPPGSLQKRGHLQGSSVPVGPGGERAF